MTVLMGTVFGSHLFGTDTESSDRDYKRVILPTDREILLMRFKPITTQNTNDSKQRNSSKDVDVELIMLHRYLELLVEGQTNAIDLMFAPDGFHTHPAHPLWRELQANRHRLLTRRAEAFVGYCEQQAAKYSVKADRLETAEAFLEMLSHHHARLPAQTKLSQIAVEVEDLVARLPFASILDIPAQNGSVRHLEVCNRKCPYTASLKFAVETVTGVVREYGQRARNLKTSEGLDFKALSHAVRVAGEAYELMTTHFVTLPRPNADYLRQVKMGLRPFEEITEVIDEGLLKAKSAAAETTLPSEPDRAFIEDFIMEAHRAVIADSLKK